MDLCEKAGRGTDRLLLARIKKKKKKLTLRKMDGWMDEYRRMKNDAEGC